MTTLQPQILINDRYLLGAALDSGQGSEVFKGEDQVLKRPVAIKLVNPEYVDVYRAALRATTHIGHPAFVGIFDSLQFDDRLAIIQEWINGQRFPDLVQAALSPIAVARIGRNIALALAHAHRQGVVHGDLTPRAIFRDQWGAVRINDVLLPPDADYFLAAGRILAAGADPWVITVPTQRDDLHAAGILLWLLLARRTAPPAEASGMSDDWQLVEGEVPETLRDIIERLADPEHPRAIETAEALINALSGCLHALDPRIASRALPPWEVSHPGAIANPATTLPNAEDESASSPAAAKGVAPDGTSVNKSAMPLVADPLPAIIGPAPSDTSDADVTWFAEPPSKLPHRGTPYATPAPPPPRDYVLWVVLGIALFLFWLVVGYLLRGLF